MISAASVTNAAAKVHEIKSWLIIAPVQPIKEIRGKVR